MGATFSGQALDDIRRVVRQVLNEPRNRIQQPPETRPHVVASVCFAYVPAGGIPARNDTTVTGVECNLYKETKVSDTEKTLVATGYAEYVFNPSTEAVGPSQYVLTSLSRHGTRYVVVESC